MNFGGVWSSGPLFVVETSVKVGAGVEDGAGVEGGAGVDGGAGFKGGIDVEDGIDVEGSAGSSSFRSSIVSGLWSLV